MKELEHIDQEIFLFFNNFHCPWWDQVMWAISGKFTFIPLYALVIGYIVYKYRKFSWIHVLLLVLVVTLADQSSVHLFKKTIMRFRPCHEPVLDGLVHIVNGKCGGKYGFVSSHAANTFAFAYLSAQFIKIRWYTWVIFLWAALVSYSRVYLGVHYPGDIIGGALLGILLGYFVLKLYDFLIKPKLYQ